MIDWLEEILKVAEEQTESEIEDGMSSLSVVSAGIAVRPLQGAGAEAEIGALPRSGRSVLDGARQRTEHEATGEEYHGTMLLQSLMGQATVIRSLSQRADMSGQDERSVNDLRRSGTDSGLRMLYRRAGEAVRSAMAPEAARSGRTVVQESPGAVVGLTAEELDRAVRRDSRRYDGGMSIY